MGGFSDARKRLRSRKWYALYSSHTCRGSGFRTHLPRRQQDNQSLAQYSLLEQESP